MINLIRDNILKNELYLLRDKLDELNDIHKKLIADIENTILINEKVIDEEDLNYVLSTINNIYNEIDCMLGISVND